jgi:seryl-tRNA synthetase
MTTLAERGTDPSTAGDQPLVSEADIRAEHLAYRAELLEARILVGTGIDGLYLRSNRFERIVRGIDALVSRTGAGVTDRPVETLHFPLLMPRTILERTDYPRSFPNLTGVVAGFGEDKIDHAALVATLDGPEPSRWTELVRPGDLALCSAACHPLYPTMQGTLPAQGQVVEVLGQCYRSEPSPDPARMQYFRQHEFVYLGSPEGAKAHRDAWIERALLLHRTLGLEVEAETANDPFFGRVGHLLAANQRSSALKFEIVAPVASRTARTAITSANLHLDHFGHEFAITTADGEPAHTACVGFGVERIALALLRRHGLDTDAWDPQVRDSLELDRGPNE